MPNWCQNELTIITETEKELDEILKAISTDKLAISFDKIIPYPEEYKLPDLQTGFNNGGMNWCTSNWGTKWDVSDIETNRQDTNYVMLKFDTAWSPPTPIVEHLRKLFPNASFSMFYREDGMQFSGWV